MTWLRKLGSSISLFFSRIVLWFQKYFVSGLKNQVLLKRILFTLFLMVIFVVVGTLTLPGLKVNEDASLSGGNEFFNIFNTIGGGGLRQFSLVSLGLSPFITASLIRTFAQTKLVPPIHRLAQSGPRGRVKINYITHGLTFFFGIIQAIIIIQTLTNNTNQNQQFVSIIEQFNTPVYLWFVLPFVLVAGTFFSIFIAEQITNKGVGNGTSMLILAGVLITLPNHFTAGYNAWIANKIGPELFKGIISFIIFLFTFLVMVFIVSFFYQAERKIPIQHIGVGRSKKLKDLSYLPLKLNPAGVMPIIFASMLVTFPMMIINLVNQFNPSGTTTWMIENFALNKPIGLVIYAASIFLITIFLGLQQSRLDKIVEDFNKNSTYIPGVRPGEQTEAYLMAIILRLSVFSAFYLTLLGSAQYFFQALGANPQLIFSGTSLIILVSVSLETIQQIQARHKAQNIFRSEHKHKVKEQQPANPVENPAPAPAPSVAASEKPKPRDGGSILW